MDLVIKNIAGVNESQDPESIKETEATVLKNFVLNKSIGKPVKRGGINLFNTNAGAAYSLHDILDSAGANYVVGQIGTNFSKSLSGTGAWSAVKGSLTSNAKTRLQTYNNSHYITNGTDAPFIITGSAFASVYTYNITKPDVSGITSINTTVPALTPNTYYQWVMVYVTASGEYSAPSAPFTHFCANSNITANSTYRGVQFSNLPVSSDGRVVRRLIFRTTGGGNIFYLCQSIDNTATVWSDIYPDTSLDQSEYITLVSTLDTAKYVTTYQERLFWGNIGIADFIPDMVYGTVSSMSAANGYSFNGTAGSGGLLTAGTYYYKIVFVDSTGKTSASRASISVTVGANGRVTFGAVPVPLDPSYQIRLYRSTDNVTFYFLNIDPRSNDDAGGTAVTSETLPSATSSSTTFNSSVVYTEIGKPSQINTINITQVLPDNGDEITGILPVADGILVFKRNSIAQIFVFGNPLNWKVQTVTTQIGCDSPNSIQKIGNRIYFISNKQVYRFPDSINTPISIPKRTTLSGLTTLYDSAYSNYYQWYILAGVFDSLNKLVVYDELLNCWYEFTYVGNINTYSVIEKTLGTTKGTLLLGGTYLYKYDESVSLDYEAAATTQEIVPTFTSKTYTFEEANALGRLRKLYVDYKKKDDQTATFTLLNPQDSGNLTVSDTTNSTLSTDYKNYEKETDAMTGAIRTCNKINLTVTGAGVTELNTAKLKYRIINRGKRQI